MDIAAQRPSNEGWRGYYAPRIDGLKIHHSQKTKTIIIKIMPAAVGQLHRLPSHMHSTICYSTSPILMGKPFRGVSLSRQGTSSLKGCTTSPTHRTDYLHCEALCPPTLPGFMTLMLCDACPACGVFVKVHI